MEWKWSQNDALRYSTFYFLCSKMTINLCVFSVQQKYWVTHWKALKRTIFIPNILYPILLYGYIFIADQKELNCWLVNWVSLIFLILLGCSNSLLVRGVSIDAEEPGGESMIFPCHYIRNKLSKQRAKKILTVAARATTDVDDKSSMENHNLSYVHSIQIKEYNA